MRCEWEVTCLFECAHLSPRWPASPLLRTHAQPCPLRSPSRVRGRRHRLGETSALSADLSCLLFACASTTSASHNTTRPRGSVRAWAEPHPRSEARWRLGELWPRSEALPSLGGASVRSRMVGSGAISLISGGSMKHVVVDVAEEGGIHQIRGRYGEIQRFSSRKRAFVGLQRPFCRQRDVSQGDLPLIF